MKTLCGAMAKLRVIDRATGHVVKDTHWLRNLVFDVGLNTLANGIGFQGLFTTCKVGSGTNPTSIQSGAVTFTQSGNTIIASSSFFTSAMTGAIMKYGSGPTGQEQYITFVNSTTATSATSATYSSPVSGVVYLVQGNSLQTFSYLTSTYQTGSANCGTTFTSTQVVCKRTFNFANQASTYNVNEIGYASNSNNDGTCNGRIVLGSTVTVTSSQFLQVVVIMTYTINPNTQTLVANVGSTINTAGTCMYQVFDCNVVSSTGGAENIAGSIFSNIMDSAGKVYVGVFTGTVTLNSTILNQFATAVNVAYILGGNTSSNSGQAVGVSLGSFTYSLTTAGETCNGMVFGATPGGSQVEGIFVLNFTTPQTLPVGTFSGTLQFTNTFQRALSN